MYVDKLREKEISLSSRDTSSRHLTPKNIIKLLPRDEANSIKKPKSGENKLKLCSKGCQRAGKPQSEQEEGRRTRPSCKFWQNKTASFNQCHIFIFISAPAAKAKYAQTNGFVGRSLVLLVRPLLWQRSEEVPGPGKTMNECAWSCH